MAKYMYTVILAGFDPKEDAVDGATKQKFNVYCDEEDDPIKKAIDANPFDKCHVFWNKKLSKIVTKESIIT